MKRRVGVGGDEREMEEGSEGRKGNRATAEVWGGALCRRRVWQLTDDGGKYLSLINRSRLRTSEVECRPLKQETQEAP